MMTVLKWIAVSAVGVAALIMIARWAFPLPDPAGRRASTAIPLSNDTALGRLLIEAEREHPGKSGVLPLASGHEALASRLLLAMQAEGSIDAQYYIWHDDISGRLLLKALCDAARRGVRVRLLLDDNGIGGLDPTIAALNALDNFEIRLFNPSTVRHPKFAGYALDFFRMNRRMHNKAFIVDGAAAIIGGRNTGNEYFDIGHETFFVDLDVLAAGSIVHATAANFDRYWNSASAYPADMIISAGTAVLPSYFEREDLSSDAAWLKQMPPPVASAAGRLAAGEASMEWTDVQLVSDTPSKGLGQARNDQLMIHELGSILGPVREQLDLVSAYFIPGNDGSAYFRKLQQGGAQVTILTNAFKTTDVSIVHAGYSKYRRALLKAGITLYELKPEEDGAAGDAGQKELSFTGSSAASLHAKTLSVDDDRIFIGSFNFDPRSTYLNCEMGFLIASPSMARQLDDVFRTGIPEDSYRVILEDGDLRWIETAKDGTKTVHAKEPGMTLVDRVVITVLSWLPIEWLL
jgi:putative cardiolipin synthase